MTRPSSLRWRLLVGVLSAVVVAWLAVAALAYRAARHEIDELLDAHLVQAAGLLAAQLLEEEEGEIEIEQTPRLHRYALQVAFQVWDHDRLRIHSLSSPLTRLSPADRGFSVGNAGGQTWRVFSTALPDRNQLLQVGERIEARQEVARETTKHFLLPLAGALPLLGLALAFAIGRGLAPLKTVTRQLSRRDPTRLEPLSGFEAPSEIRPLVDQLNSLFQRIQDLLDNLRRFTADASHELRTPLAAIRAQAEVALVASDDAERRHAMQGVIQGCDRASRLIDQLLTLARLEATEPRIADTECNLAGLSKSVLADLGPWAVAKGVSLSLVAGGDTNVRGDETLLRVLVRNLVDNAIRYSPAASEVAVHVATSDLGIDLEIMDQGPGIPEAERSRVLDRFYRIPGFEDGSGLGLSIVERITKICGADLRLLENIPVGGLRVLVHFPRP